MKKDIKGVVVYRFTDFVVILDITNDDQDTYTVSDIDAARRFVSNDYVLFDIDDNNKVGNIRLLKRESIFSKIKTLFKILFSIKDR